MEYKNTQHINILLKLNRIRKMLTAVFLFHCRDPNNSYNQKLLIQSTAFVVDVSPVWAYISRRQNGQNIIHYIFLEVLGMIL